jgi:hypothetical protein
MTVVVGSKAVDRRRIDVMAMVVRRKENIQTVEGI